MTAPMKVKCPECSVWVNAKNYAKHLRTVHESTSPEPLKPAPPTPHPPKERCNTCGAYVRAGMLKVHRERAHGSGPLRLMSSRGYRQDIFGRCASCGKKKRPLWRYAQSTRGPVLICGSCKPALRDRSFGSKDALDTAIRGGAWEQNRRRH